MNALKLSNILLASCLVVTALAWTIKGGGSVGGLTALALPTVTFLASFAALQTGKKRLAAVSQWLNILLLTTFLAVDAAALFVFNTSVGNAVAIIAFQAVIIAMPAVANIVAMRRLTSSQ